MAPLAKACVLAPRPGRDFAVLDMSSGVLPLRFQWDLAVVSFQPCVLHRLAMYCEGGAAFLQEIAAFQGLGELVTPLGKEGCAVRSEWSCGESDDVSAKMV